jgi:hypothetical protein
MWARLDDELIDHPKIFEAGKRIGPNGPGLALALYAVALMWTNRQLTDGYIPLSTLQAFPHLVKPAAVADALVSAGLFEKVKDGYQIHDFSDHNPSAKAIKRKRRDDRDRKREERAHDRAKGNGHG